MSCSSILNGWATASSSFRAIRPSTAGSSKSSTTTMNSSPPSRASRSDLAQRGGERGADALQELVADPVPERVVDVLEPVEVDEQHADATAAALRLRDRLREPLVQQQPVGQSRQRVARRHVLQALLGLDPRRNVLHERENRRRCCRGRRAGTSGTTRTRSSARPCGCCASGPSSAAPRRS